MYKEDNKFDREIREGMQRVCDGLSPSEESRQHIWFTVHMNERAKKRSSLPGRISGAAALLIIAFLAGGAFALAAGIITQTISSSGNGFDYSRYEDLKKAEKKSGYTIHVPESFSNGYRFKGITLVSTRYEDNDGTVDHESSDIEVTFENDAEKEIILDTFSTADAGTDPRPLEDRQWQAEEEYQGTALYYAKVEYLSVPDGYTPTEEEMEREESDPFFHINYGDEVKPVTYFDESVLFDYEGVQYDLHSMNTDLTAEDMIGMAEEIIDYAGNKH